MSDQRTEEQNKNDQKDTSNRKKETLALLATIDSQRSNDPYKNQHNKQSQRLISLLENYYNLQLLLKSVPKKTFISTENFQKLKKLFLNFESYTSLMLGDSSDLLRTRKYSTVKVEKRYEIIKKKKSEDFYLCNLCSHCFSEPITLSCGCTFCKKCLTEYLYFISHHFLKSRSSIYCFNCSKVKINENYCDIDTMISKLTQEIWPVSVEVKQLRNEIRKYIISSSEVTGEFYFEEYEYLLNHIYLKGKINTYIQKIKFRQV